MAKRAASRPGELGAETRIALFHGPEVFLHHEYTEQLREALKAAHGEIAVFSFDADGTPVAAVLDECRTFGLMATHKLVVVDNADKLVKEDSRPLVERYAESPCESATLVLRASRWYKGKLDGMIEKVGVVMKCEEPDRPFARDWAIRRALERHRVTINPDAATLLVERVGPDLGRLEGELAKLAAGVATAKGGTITRKEVSELVGVSREEEVWAIQSTMLSHDPKVALAGLREALDIGRHHPVLVSWACCDLARKLHGAARGLASGAKPFDLMKSLRLCGPSGERILSAAKRIGPDRAADLLEAAIENDHRQKTGRTDPDRGLEILALKFAGA